MQAAAASCYAPHKSDPACSTSRRSNSQSHTHTQRERAWASSSSSSSWSPHPSAGQTAHAACKLIQCNTMPGNKVSNVVWVPWLRCLREQLEQSDCRGAGWAKGCTGCRRRQVAWFPAVVAGNHQTLFSAARCRSNLVLLLFFFFFSFFCGPG